MSDSRIQLCLVLHNHQPVGNFDDVIEQAYRQSYLPFLDVFAPYTSLKISLHTSGPLLLWLEEHYPEYLNRLANLVAQERVEIIGGAFYEPILSMIPSRDRGGQISRFSNWLNNRFHTEVRGMWIPERVWETSLVSNIAGAGIEYTVLDDFHFRCAGLGSDDLLGSYVTEDQGHTLRVYPGSEQLRYAIPFQEPSATIDHLREIQHQLGSATVVFADDGEKFGSWPDTYKHVYDEGWLKRFFDTLVENQDWLTTTTLGTATRSSIPQGNIYLPDASYREMTEWSLPTGAQLEYEEIRDEFENDWRWPKLKKFIRGGFWRNFKRKYSETNEMYSRMMYVSKRLEQAEHTEHCDHNLLDQAKDHLYRGQCNCAYWHGAFGGVYLPHLRNAVFRHLILADNLIERAIGADGWSLEAGDFNFDQRAEVRLSNDDLVCWICPSRGGHMYELDIRSLCHNLLATMQRRPEAYHEKVKQGQNENSDSASSIHDRVVFKQDNLDQMLVYDSSPRKSLVDHFWPVEVKLDDVANGKADELGEFVEGK